LATLFPPELVKALRLTAPPVHDGRAPPDLATASTSEKAHGRIETRTITISRECVAHLNWPGATHVCRIERTRERAGTVSREIAYAVTSLPDERARPQHVLALWRDHWLIENRLHWRRDVIGREDHSRVRSGSIPQAMAALRNAMMFLTQSAPTPLPATREAMAEDRIKAIQTAINGVL